MSEVADIETVRAFYASKTASIIEKYGPGPRIHFHTGLVEDGPAMAGDANEIRAAMVRAQERLLELVRDQAPSPIAGRLLDVGCGLGGGSIFWATEPAVRSVTAITIEPTHVAVLRRFAAAAGVGGKIVARLHDANERLAAAAFDHIIAIESACYLDRVRFARAAFEALVPGGTLHLVDCFRGDESDLGWFDAYWKTRLGTLTECVLALRVAGFCGDVVEDLAPRAMGFWDMSTAWIDLAVADREARDRKTAAHRRLRRSLGDGTVRYLHVTASRP